MRYIKRIVIENTIFHGMFDHQYLFESLNVHGLKCAKSSKKSLLSDSKCIEYLSSTMADLYTPYRNYVKKMLTFQGREKGTAKVLILDNETVRMIRNRWFISRRPSRLLLLSPRPRFWTMMVCFA